MFVFVFVCDDSPDSVWPAYRSESIRGDELATDFKRQSALEHTFLPFPLRRKRSDKIRGFRLRTQTD